MISRQADEPIDTLVGELFRRNARRRGLVLGGWLLAFGSHAAAAVLISGQRPATAIERTPPPVDVEFVTPSPPPTEDLHEDRGVATRSVAAAAPPAAARAGALHLAKPDAAPGQQTEQAVDFTNDPHGATYGGGVVAVGGTAAFGAVGARLTPTPGTAVSASAQARPLGDALTALADLSRKPQLPGSDPCRGFFPAGAREDAGDVAVLVTINKTGRVANTRLLSETPSSQGFGAAARACLASRQFVPALDRAGNLAATAVRVNLRFSR
ncbi:MAG: energy transducer TonB [Polyangiaceae bacterium]